MKSEQNDTGAGEEAIGDQTGAATTVQAVRRVEHHRLPGPSMVTAEANETISKDTAARPPYGMVPSFLLIF